MDVAFGGVPGVGVVVPERDSLALFSNDLIAADMAFGRCAAVLLKDDTRLVLNVELETGSGGRGELCTVYMLP